MKVKNNILKRTLSLILALSVLLVSLPIMSFMTTAAATDDNRITDPVTWNNWQRVMGSSVGTTANAGGVWTDKSVFKTDDQTLQEYFADVDGLTVDDKDNNFLVALSAMASNKSIIGYSHAVTDTILVLDISNSMRYAQWGESSSDRNDVVQPMIDATNAAITELLKLNKLNRVGVVLYSSASGQRPASRVLMPLGRYTATKTETYNAGTPNDTSDDKTINVYFETDAANGNNGDEIQVADGVINEKTKEEYRHNDVDVEGGTYIQSGIDKAMDTFLAVEDTAVEGEDFQSGSNRMPVMVLLSDGEPTYATTSYDDVGSSNLGSGSSSNARMAFATQLTAAYAKRKISEHYNNEDMLFYTLGFKVSGHAVGVLNPEKYNDTDSYWRAFLNAEDGDNVVVGAGSNGKGGTTFKKNDYVTADYRYYVNDYFSADTELGLYSAFDAIVSQIIIQSLYYPTNVTNGNVDMGGYIEFHDDIGEYMEIKSIKGTMLGDTLFTGALLARNFREDGGDLGTVDNPNDLGDNMVWAVQQRLGLDSVQDARDLIDMAYRAGQLSYTSDTEFSNYIGWYADENGEYLGFWQEGFTEDDYPKGTTPTYINKSYGMLGSVEDGHKKTDMMYVSIQVHQNIATGKTQLIWKIPSSLIPVVQYEISLEGTGLDEGEYEEDSIKVTVSDKKPIRLLYEIGLRSDINAINVAEKVASNYAYKDYYKNSKGKEGYVFFTNAWEDDEVALRQDPVHAVNTVSFFEPSFENERYYYTENTPIWEFDGGKYTRYTGATAPNPNGVYYREFKIFEFDANGKATIKKEHEQISEYVLTEANGRIGKNNDNTWYVKPDTIHRFAQPYTYDKADNTTASLEFAHIPAVQLNDHNHYYADTILGNNGAYILEPAQGLKITKTVDVIEPNTDTDFSFKIETDLEPSDALTETFETLLIDADGKETKGEINFEIELGKAIATVDIAVNETLYILGLPDGTEYTVTELDNADYKVKSATLNGVLDTDNIVENTITHHTIDSIAFVNTPKTSGHLIIRKTVEHPFESDPEGLSNKEFEFEITVNTIQDIDGKEFEATITNGTTQNVTATATLIESQTRLEDKNYKLTFNGENLKLNHNEFISIKDLPLYADVTVKEINIPDGFESDKTDNTATVEILEEENVAIRFTNNYTPDKVSPTNVTVEGNKKVTGRVWLDDDEFSFTLQKLVSGVWTDLDTATATKASSDFDFNDAIAEEEYTQAGTYSYRVIEAKGIKGGITYDPTVFWFDIVVTDNDMDGKLEIANVTSSNATVTKNNSNYNVEVEFDNKYAPTDAGDITINIKKTFDPDITKGKDVSLAGYQFGLYAKEYNGSGDFTGNWLLAATSNVTSAAGEAQIKMIYLAQMLIAENGDNLGSVSLDYQLKEIVPEGADKVAGVIYNTDTVYNIKVVLTDNLKGKVEAVVYIDNGNQNDKDGADNKLELAETPVIENVYDPDDAKEILTAKKTMTGRNPDANEFTFNLYKATVSGSTWTKDGSAIDTKKNDANGNITFDELTFSDIQNYYYIIEEADEGKGGINYDTTKYYVTVAVTDNGDGTLGSEVSITDDKLVDATEMEFANVYTATGTLDGFTAKKTISGRPLQSFDIFDFELYEADSGWNTVGNPIQTKANNTGGNITFEDLSYDLDDLGSKRYIIKEKAGQSGNGITCTTAEYRITVNISDNKNGTLNAVVASVTDKNGAAKTEMEFVNTYTTTGEVSVPLTATKKLEGRDWLATDEFTFEVYKATVSGSTWTKNGSAIQSKTSKTENVVFDDLKFTDDGTYYFIVTEKAGASNVGITYSTAEYHVTVKIKENYQTGKFEFESKTVTDKSGSTAEIKFTNNYSTTSIYADLTATKELEGIRDLEAGEFSFELYKAKVSGGTWSKDGSAIQTKKNTEGGEVNFDRITYNEVSTNRYILVETQGNKGGVEYSKEEYHITVEVTDNMKGALVSKTTITDKNGATAEPKFINFYTASGTDATFKAEKLLEGRELQADEFSFELYDATVTDNVWATDGEPLQTKSNGSGDTVNDILFDTIDYTEPATFYYIIKEVKGDKERVTYSEEEYHITVKVEDNKLGALETDITITDKDGSVAETMVFNNVYTPKPDDTTLDFNIEKTVKNIGDKEIGPDGFTFILESEALEEAMKVTTDKDGKAVFTLAFTEDDIGNTYTYTLYEKNDGKLYTEYSTARYVYEVKVLLNDDNVIYTVVKSGEEELEEIVAEFENVYDEKIPEDKPEEPKQPESPKTSDSKAVILLAVLMLLSGTAFVIILSKAKRVNHN